MKRFAFTLVEILVVVLIIATLAAITFPALAAAKTKAKDATCLANLRQLGVALSSYAANHDDLLPTESSTPLNPRIPHPILTSLKAYGLQSELLRCPRDYFLDLDTSVVHFENNYFQRCGSSYEINLVLGKYSMSGVPNPSGSLLASDFFSFHSAPTQTVQWFQVLFFDGHVKKENWNRRAELAFNPNP